ncbi:MAG: hypothetical protein ABIQ86_02510 [Steroidobacteraceae bacterium]
MQNPQSPLATLIPIIIVFAVFLLRMRKMTGVRPMKLQALWIRPAIVSVIAAILVYSAPPQSALQGVVLLAALGLGALLGWHQGKLMQITVDAETGSLQVKASLIAMTIFFGLILLRMGLRPWLTGATSPLHAYVGIVTDGSILFIVGFYIARAAEMFIRGRALLSAVNPSVR